MDIDIKELVRIATENMNLKDFKGDVVAVKVVENEFGTIEEGGIGVQYNYYHTTEEKEPTEETPLMKELMPIFMNVKAEVEAFIAAIDGQKPTAVTEKVNELVRQGKITKAGRKGDLHGILNRYGLYKPGVDTWNKQVN